MCDPHGCATALGAVEGADPTRPPWLTRPLGVNGSGGQPSGSLGVWPVGTQTYIPKNDSHDMLIILNTHKSGKNFAKQICRSSQAPISQGPTRSPGRGKNPLLGYSGTFEFSTKC